MTLITRRNDEQIEQLNQNAVTENSSFNGQLVAQKTKNIAAPMLTQQDRAVLGNLIKDLSELKVQEIPNKAGTTQLKNNTAVEKKTENAAGVLKSDKAETQSEKPVSEVEKQDRLKKVQEDLAVRITAGLAGGDVTLQQIAVLVRTQFALMSAQGAVFDTQKMNELTRKLEEVNNDLVHTYKGTKNIINLVVQIGFGAAQTVAGVGLGIGGIFVPVLATAGSTITQGISGLSGVTQTGKEMFIESERTGLSGQKSLTDTEQQETRNTKDGKNNMKKSTFEEMAQAWNQFMQAIQAIFRG